MENSSKAHKSRHTCEKYAYSKNGLRHMEYSESETLMADLQDQVPGEAETLEAVTISIISSSSSPGSSLSMYYGMYILFPAIT
jgi:hypothetical protein